MPGNSAFESLVQTIGGSQVFVAPGISAPLVELRPGAGTEYLPRRPDQRTLAPGVRELPSALDVAILHIVAPAAPAPSTPPAPVAIVPATTSPASPATVIDQAVAALTSTATTDGSSPPATPVNTVTLTGQPTNHGKRHKVSVKTKHSEPSRGHKAATHKVITPVGHKGGKPALHTPNASLAVELSLAGRETTRRFHRPFKP